MKQLVTFVISTTTIMFGVTAPVVQVLAQTPAYRLIARDTAASDRIQVPVTPGRATPISFSKTDEAIAYILLADASRLTYTTDTDINSGRATTIFLRKIQPLKFPGATTTAMTNLLVQTLDQKGQKRLYNFDIVLQRHHTEYVGIQIANAIAGQQTILIDTNRRVTVDEIETGLRIALNRGYTHNSDPVVLKVRQALALLRNSSATIPEVATSVGVPIEVISELGKIASGEGLLRRLRNAKVRQ
ncbi:hypothetical protein PN483_10440 [Nodularia spumigena CS-591/04]|uniref:hypothetical protein n=1 Tax=Nodularia spumigena TaxID=70799 RepID=UPI00232E7FA9|nr:hypothetical protein [Nodularia spumigena]MDB9322346.1 hypothetical protein [Nodularia spumigena CS-591/07A]MDB9330906.1 hypothetical protein [Nodularia spumigena CS-591/04]MDB9360211.1 hypothetical protein [Nodularia spumigena CS-588/02]MDB9366154.1 hypothetical protein [Nodularia spumigena CS-588/02A10]